MIGSVAGMAHQATSTRPGPGAGVRAAVRAVTEGARASESLRAAWRTFAWSRLAILAVAAFAALSAGSGGVGAANAERFDEPSLTRPLGGLGDALASPLAHWDAVWYLGIAESGYPSADSPRAAFFPLYPLLTRAVAQAGGGSRGALLLAAYAVSLVALLAALVLLYRLAALELGRRLAAPTLLLLSVFPASLFLGAPYSESLYLLASVGAFYAARTGHWAWAGVAAAAASGTRSAGVLLLLPLALIYLYGPREGKGAVLAGEGKVQCLPEQRPGCAPPRTFRLRSSPKDKAPDRTLATGEGWLAALRPGYALRADAAWLLLAPAGLVAYATYLGFAHGDALAFGSVQEYWAREFAGPLKGFWEGVVAAVDGARQIASGSRDPVFFEQAGGDPFRAAAMNLMLLATLVFALAGTVGVLRRLPFAYGAYVAAALMLPLSYPVGPQPLMSLPRFVVVLFPIFMWLALVCGERRITDRAAAASAVGLGLFVTQFAGWQFVS